ncbi:MAG: hypothetical protein Q9162_007591 [Coniocarpon cinnabarinum]
MTSPGEDVSPATASNGPESRQSTAASAGVGSSATPNNQQGGGPRKRASRAGTRSVSTLSAAQLERKRANDREAQRAIRARTKEHIEKLERRIHELTSSDERNEQLLAALKRNKELEEENQMLRASLEQAHYTLGVSPPSANTPWQSVPHLKTPIPNQPMRMSSQQDMRGQITSPQSALPRVESTGYPGGHQWQSSNPFGSPVSATRGTAPPQRPAESQAGMQEHWNKYGRERAQTTPIDDYKPLQSSISQSSGYSYMPTPQEQTAGPRTNSQPSLYQGSPESHDQRMRNLSEQLGLSPVEMNTYGQSANRQGLMMHQNQYQQQSQSQIPSQHAPQYPQPPSDSIKPSPADPPPQPQQQPMFYGPYSR